MKASLLYGQGVIDIIVNTSKATVIQPAFVPGISHDSPESLLKTILTPGFSMHDQWEAQLFAMIRTKADLSLCSALSDQDVRKAYMTPTGDINDYIEKVLRKTGKNTPVAIMPEGPLTIPYIKEK